jgi:hypothetical protein
MNSRAKLAKLDHRYKTGEIGRHEYATERAKILAAAEPYEQLDHLRELDSVRERDLDAMIVNEAMLRDFVPRRELAEVESDLLTAHATIASLRAQLEAVPESCYPNLCQEIRDLKAEVERVKAAAELQHKLDRDLRDAQDRDWQRDYNELSARFYAAAGKNPADAPRLAALEAVALAAMRYSKAQSARYQRELLEAIDALERTPKGST